MIDTLPAVRTKWASFLADDLRLGIGVHTGVARVGNSGSRRRWKYGPRGANVHLASRVESATKAVGVPLIATGATAARLSNRLLCHRLCRVQMPGIAEPVELYGVRSATSEPRILAAIADYQRALEHFEQGRCNDAAATLARIGESTPLPIAFLSAQIQRALGSQLARRSTDSPSTGNGSIELLNVKNG
jgi:adenylate cyclase